MSAAAEGFPWRRLMELGLGVLRLSPKDFWAATPSEIAAAFPTSTMPAPARADLDRLMREFPDSHD